MILLRYTYPAGAVMLLVSAFVAYLFTSDEWVAPILLGCAILWYVGIPRLQRLVSVPRRRKRKRFCGRKSHFHG